MLVSVLIGIIVAVCLVSTLIFYVFIQSQEKPPSSSTSSLNEKQQIKYSLRPSMDIITKKLHQDFPFRFSASSNKSTRSSLKDKENEFLTSRQHKSTESISSPIRSTSMIGNLLPPQRPRSTNFRQGSIVDPNQLALIKFTLPPTTTDANNKYRRRSVAICNNIIETKENPITTINTKLPCLLSFSITYLKSSQIKIDFHSIQSLPGNIHLQQLTIKVKLVPDGKEKSISIKKLIENDTIFADENNQYSIIFSNIPLEKFHERCLSMTVHGKDQAKKTIHLGQIGKIMFNQIDKFDNENRVDFTHEIEKTKPSSVEILVALEKQDDQHVKVDLQRIKGLKVDQKKLDAKCFLQIILFDHHRPLSMHQTKSFRLNSSNCTIGEQFCFNILTFNSNNLDRLMIMCNLYSNSNPTNEFKLIAYTKLASPLFCSGSGTIHWQQFKARDSFSMWHTLNKEQR